MQFLTCLRNIKVDFRCLGAMPECDLSSDEDDDEEEESDHIHNKSVNRSDNKEKEEVDESGKSSRTVFSNWFMVLEENKKHTEHVKSDNEPESPPANALLLMRCRSAPAKSWLENRTKVIVEEEEEEEADENEERDRDRERRVEDEEEEERMSETGEKQRRKKLRDYLVVMEYDTELYKLSNDVAKETWVVGSVSPFSRSRSSRR